MAIVIEGTFPLGTHNGVTSYKNKYNQQIVRKKSSLTGQRVKQSLKFRRTMENAGLLGQSSKIAAAVYRLLPEDMRKHSFYKELTGKAVKLLHEGKTAEEVREILYPGFL